MSELSNATPPPSHLFWDIRTGNTTSLGNAGAKSGNRLHTRLLSLRKRYGSGFLSSANTPEEMLQRFCDLLFPAGRVSDYLISNITVNADPFLLIRPSALLPSHEAEWPSGFTLAAKGYVERRSNQFRMIDISDMADFSARPFERSLRAVPVRGYPRQGESVEPSLDSEWLKTLPLISKETANALQQWTNYLDWKQKLVQAGIAGVRYVSRTLHEDGTWRFVIAVLDGADATSIARLLRSDDLSAYDLDYSTDPWNFTYRENSKARAQALGDAIPGTQVTLERDALPCAPSRDELPAAQFREVSYRLEDGDYERLLALAEADGLEAAAKAFENRLPATGFLAVSAAGDMALIRRQREELQRLQKESGFAPFVSAYLFDIGQARTPSEWHDIAPQDWLRTDMNADQRKAVQMMVSTPDLSLIQGPPGTGKTTMIAEAVYQLARQGKKVLVASQANLAVDNALERLGDTPVIRALRLGAKADKDSQFIRENALGSYYRSVANACQQKHLGKWEAMQAEARNLEEWIATTELIASDLRQAEERIERGRELRDRSAQERQLLQRRIDETTARRERLDEAAEFIDVAMSGQQDWSGTLPDDLRQPWHVALGRVQALLSKAGLFIGRPLGLFDAAAGCEQSNQLLLTANMCHQLLGRLPSLRNELRRLSQLQTEQLISAETETLVTALSAEKARLLTLFVDGDETAAPLLREISQRLKTLARDGGLSSELYEAAFDQSNATRLLSAGSTRTQVVESLQRAVSALRRVHAWRRTADVFARAQLASAITTIADTAAIEQQLTQVSRGLRDLDHQLAEDMQRRGQHLANLGEQLDAPAPADNWRSACTHAIEAKRARHEVVGNGLRQTASLRKDWAPVLAEWVSVLNDQAQPGRGEATSERYLSDAFIENCNVVGITCSERRSTLTDAGHDYFDVAIVDEVSKATPPELLMCISMARTAILVGDHRQLPPVFKEGISAEQYLEQFEDQEDAPPADPASDTALTRENLDRFSDMVSASLFKRHFEEAPAALKAFLFTQYRMHPQIMDVVNAFYEGRLTCGLSDPDGRQPGTATRDIRQHGLQLAGPDRIPYLEPDQHVLWIDSGKTPDGRDTFERRAGAGGKVNDTEAALIAKLLADLDDAHARQGYGQGGKRPKEVGIVTFYARQIRVIKDAIAALTRTRGAFTAIKVDVNTADRYQGQERPIIIVSLVRSPRHRLSALANTAQFERINVAFSRAQELLVILGSERTFRAYEIKLPHLDRPGHTRRAVYGQIIGEIELNGGFKRARQLIDQVSFDRLLPAGATSDRPHAAPAEFGRKDRKPNNGRPGGAR